MGTKSLGWHALFPSSICCWTFLFRHRWNHFLRSSAGKSSRSPLKIGTATSTNNHPTFEIIFHFFIRPLGGHLQDVTSLASYLKQFTPDRFIDAASDFHFLAYIATMDMFPLMVTKHSRINIRADHLTSSNWFSRKTWVRYWKRSRPKMRLSLKDGLQAISGAQWHNYWPTPVLCRWTASRWKERLLVCRLKASRGPVFIARLSIPRN